MLAQDNENFRAPGENRTRDLPNPRLDVLPLNHQGSSYTRSKFHTRRVSIPSNAIEGRIA